MSGDSSLQRFEFFQISIKPQIEALKTGLKKLLEKSSTETFSFLQNISQTIKQLAENEKIKPLSKLIDCFVDVFGLAKKGELKLSNDDISLLISVVEEIDMLRGSKSMEEITKQQDKWDNLFVVAKSLQKKSTKPPEEKEKTIEKSVEEIDVKGLHDSLAKEIDDTLLNLFRIEVEMQRKLLSDCLLELEKNPSKECLESLMRASHSIKGAARVINLNEIVSLAHTMLIPSSSK